MRFDSVVVCGRLVGSTPTLLTIYMGYSHGAISNAMSYESKNYRVRTGVGWTGLLRKLYENREVRVFYNPPFGITVGNRV